MDAKIHGLLHCARTHTFSEVARSWSLLGFVFLIDMQNVQQAVDDGRKENRCDTQESHTAV
jgi:hypothetical protein